MNAYYLDSMEEIASAAILRELDVVYTPNLQHAENISPMQYSKSLDIHHEHVSNTASTIVAVSGILFVDFRDAADNWIRCALQSHLSAITLPANVFRRILTPSFGAAEFFVSSADYFTSMQRRYVVESDAPITVTKHPYRELICELCRQFYSQGWVTGTGGSITVRFGGRIYMTPSGVQKERIQPDELFMLDIDGNILCTPPKKPGCKPPKLSDCSPLFLHAYRLRKAGAVIHSHDITCVMAIAISENPNEFRIRRQEMIKGIAGYSYTDELVIPVIDNTSLEYELADSLEAAIRAYPKACAVLVRDHGIYVWGDSWEQAKRHSECLHYLFQLAIDMHRSKVGMFAPSITTGCGCCQTTSPRRRKHVVLDIEGTTTPITFVKDVLFPYAAQHCLRFLTTNANTSETQSDIAALAKQALQDIADKVACPVLSDAAFVAFCQAAVFNSVSSEMLEKLSEYVQWNIAQDRKISSLKQLQGHIWLAGYESGELVSIVFDDIPRFFKRMKNAGAQLSIYSSGSRQAQHLLFRYSNHGDLRKMLSCYFDTSIGHKRTSNSYKEILLTLGADSPSDVLFLTDVYEEAEAASEVGLEVILSVREGNAPLPEIHPFRTVTTFDDI